MSDLSWPDRVHFPGESRLRNGWMDPNEYVLAISEPRNYPNGPALPLDGPIPADHPVVAAAREARQYRIRIHRDRFIEARRFLHAEIAGERVGAIHHWWHGKYCEMDLATFRELLDVLEVDLSQMPATPHADIVATAVGNFMSILQRGEQQMLRISLEIRTSELNPYIPQVLYGEAGEAALKHFANSRYVPPIPFKKNFMRI